MVSSCFILTSTIIHHPPWFLGGWSSHAVRSNKWPTWPTTKGHHHVVHAKPKPLTGRKVWWFRGISWLRMGDSFGNKAISWYQLLHIFWLVTSTHAERYANTISCCREPDKLHLTLPTNVPKGLIAVFQGSCAATTLCHYSRRQGLPSRLRQTTQIWHTLNWKAKTSSIFFGQYWLSVMFSTSKQKNIFEHIMKPEFFHIAGMDTMLPMRFHLWGPHGSRWKVWICACDGNSTNCKWKNNGNLIWIECAKQKACD